MERDEQRSSCHTTPYQHRGISIHTYARILLFANIHFLQPPYKYTVYGGGGSIDYRLYSIL